ncbi:lysophospholipid acyltransferase family protein [Chloroflexota bacterium]
MIRWYYYIARYACIIFFRLFTSWRTEGLENVPQKGAVLIVSNHLSNADPPLVSVTLNRNTLFMAKEELFKNPILGYFMFGFGAFPVHRGQLDRKALRHAEKILSENQILAMFPEATRSKDAKLRTAYPGSALIAERNNVPIVPVAITGTEKLAGWSWLYHRYPILIRFGQPFNLPQSDAKRTRDTLDESTRIIMEQIAALLPVKYRGVYGSQDIKDEPID